MKPEFRHPFSLISIIIAAFVSMSAVNISDFRFHSLPETSYYGGVHSVTKDSIGRIWFSGSDAVYMYDGISFNRFNEHVTAVDPDSYWTFLQVVTAADKLVYVGTNNGLMKLDYATKNFTRVLDGKISYLAVDHEGVIWMIHNDSIESLSPLEGNKNVKYPLPEGMDVNPLSLYMSCARDNVYVSVGSVIYTLNPETGNYSKFCDVGIKDCMMRDVEIFNSTVYVLTARNGIFGFSPEGGKPCVNYKLPKEYESSTIAKELYLAQDGMLWAATQSGLFLVDLSTKKTGMLRTNIHYPYSLPNNSVWTVYPDPDGGVWIGTYGGKLAYMPVSDSGGDWFKATPGGLSHSIVSCFEEDPKGNLWIGTEGGGVNYWDRINNRFICYTQENNSGLRSNMIKKLHYDTQGRLLVSSFNGGMQVYDPETNIFEDLAAGTEYPPFMSIYDFVKNGAYGYWISDPDSPLRYLNTKRKTVEVNLLYNNGKLVKPRIENMYRSIDGSLCLVTSQGLYILDDKGNIKQHHRLENVSFAKNDLCCYHLSADGMTWFGTRGGGLDLITKEGDFIAFYDRNGNGLEGKTIFAILDEKSTGDLWISTDNGLYIYDKSEDEFRRSTIDSDNLCGAYYVRSAFRTSDGKMLFGGTDGFVMLDPEKIGSNTLKPKPFFVDMKINSSSIDIMSGSSPLSADISTYSSSEKDNRIRLTHKQSNFEIFFSSDCWQDADKTIFAYRMLGLSDKWNQLPQGQRSVAFFDLAPGKYTFELKAANSDGVWGDKVVSLSFRISPSPFLSVWAYIIYLLVFCASCYFVWNYLSHKKKFKEELDQKEAELTELYSKKYVAGPSEIVVTSLEDELLKKALDCIERNMDNSDYGVEDFVSDMAVGRTALYQRINSITGKSIKEFILDIRLKRAAKLLSESDKTIAEVSYMTGFLNPKYFSTIFKKHFGMTPSEFKRSRS